MNIRKSVSEFTFVKSFDEIDILDFVKSDFLDLAKFEFLDIANLAMVNRFSILPPILPAIVLLIPPDIL